MTVEINVATNTAAHIFNMFAFLANAESRPMPFTLIAPPSNYDSAPINSPARWSANVPLMRSVAAKSTLPSLARIALSRMVAAFAAFSLMSLSAVAGAAVEIGKPAPELVVTQLDGQTFDLAKLKGKAVLVNYWATWCAPCKKDMPKLDGFYRRYHDRNLEMIAISVDRERDLPKARKVAASLAYPSAILKGITVDGFGPPSGVPITWIVDGEGTVRDMMIDVRDELLTGLVLPLLRP